MRRIKVLIKDSGEIVVEAEGYKGPACLKDFQKLVEALKGLGVNLDGTETKLKPEYHEVPSEVLAGTREEVQA